MDQLTFNCLKSKIKPWNNLKNMFKVNKKDNRTTSVYVYPLSLFAIFKHIALLALEFLLLRLSR